MAFDPSILQPAGGRTPIPPEMLGMREDQYQDIPAAQRPMQQWFTTPDGKTIVKRDQLGGGSYYETERVGEQALRFKQGANGEWETEQFNNGGWSQLSKNATKDPKFMTFLALVAGGVIASAYLAPAAGATAVGTAPAATAGVAPAAAGAAPGVGGLTATQAAGAVSAAGSVASAGGGGGGDGAAPYGSDGIYNDDGYSLPGQYQTNDLTNINSVIPQESWADIAKNFGGDVLAWAKANPQLVAGLGGAAAGALANSGDFTSSTTTTNTIDPAIAAYRDKVLGQAGNFAGGATQYGAGGTTQQPGSGQQMAGIQGGTGADFEPGGRFYNGGGSTGQSVGAGTQGATGYDAATNPYATGDNPYLTGMVDSASNDMRKYYDQFIAPKFASGSSFGSSGLGFLEAAERDNQADQFSELVGNLRFQDYSQRAGLAEQQAGRQDAASQFNVNTGIGVFNDYEKAQQERMRIAMAGMAAPGNTTSTTSSTAQGNPWLGGLGGFLAGSSLWGAPGAKQQTKGVF